MNRHFIIFAAALFSFLCRGADVAIIPSQTFQTIEGWGNGGGNLGGEFDDTFVELGAAISDPLNFQLIDFSRTIWE